MLLYRLTIFIGAFLLFAIQPLVARILLPQFGGTATVWTTCMMVFQVGLLIGYLYAHALQRLTSPIRSWLIHSMLLVAAFFAIRLDLANSAAADPTGYLAWQVSVALAISIGLPFAVLSATGPLVQAWHSVSHREGQTYRLFAVSNAGSMAALLLYPLAVEPWVGFASQSWFWQAAFVLFAALMIASGWQLQGQTKWAPSTPDKLAEQSDSRSSTLRLFPVWMLLAGLASAVLLAATNVLCREVASWPFLWVLPLSCYLLGLILCFGSRSFYRRRVIQPLLTVSIFAAVILFHLGTKAALIYQAIGWSALVLLVSITCHGELARLKPAVGDLTLFYLAIALGGAVGSIFVAVLAPQLFNGYYEFHVSLLACLIVVGVLVWFDQAASRKSAVTPLTIYALMLSGASSAVVCSLIVLLGIEHGEQTRFQARNALGKITVQDVDGFRIMFSGSTSHGGQLLGDGAQEPNAYYARGSGADVAFAKMRERRGHRLGMRLGVIGLGSGSLAAYERSVDRFRFYELNPLVAQAAREFFTWLDGPGMSGPSTSIAIGDGRVLLQNELRDGSQQFDLLFIDAFSSDSIPVHLLTSECFDLYLQHLASDGIIICHITNRFVDLRPVLWTMAEEKNLQATLIDHYNDEMNVWSRWVLMTPATGHALTIENETPWPKSMKRIFWTDDFASLSPVVRWTSDWRSEDPPAAHAEESE